MRAISVRLFDRELADNLALKWPSLEVAATRAPTATIATSSLTLCGREACTANTNVTTPPKMAMGRSGRRNSIGKD
eukprot:CAMPEP_0115446150 /NCGR_PEP_ID=MMETSP0271-20121206/39297_1 /TAXON_ID=71861 /ORGANISM="Scrippsiella trochoidea, Strain CCMP3099" /LENGTH=75 /DNA_ID=CAMNT_0002872171 /DNA_START=483 /DNA_END=708 /DNA_ORIENTATION=+